MNLPKIKRIEDFDKEISISQWDLIAVAESFQRKGFYIGVFVGLGLVGLLTFIRSIKDK